MSQADIRPISIQEQTELKKCAQLAQHLAEEAGQLLDFDGMPALLIERTKGHRDAFQLMADILREAANPQLPIVVTEYSADFVEMVKAAMKMIRAGVTAGMKKGVTE